MEEKNIVEKLIAIQNEIKVKKTRYNKFAQNPFYYRNVEDILSAAKPICQKHGCLLTLTDDVVLIGDRYYIKATAVLSSGNDKLTTTSLAREQETRKGFDPAQLTGSASTYARKYALNGLLGLDDTEDPDSQNNNANFETRCPQCGGVVEGYTGRSGKWYNPADIIEKYGKCIKCVKAERG